MKTRKNYWLIYIVLCGLGYRTLAQPTLHVNFGVVVEGGSREGSKIIIERDGQKWKTKNGDLPRSFLELEYQHDYLFSFTKYGYVTKKIFVSTKIPEEETKKTFKPFVFDVTLFKQEDGVNLKIFDQPVAKIIYDKDKVDFGYDTDYTSSVMAAIQNTEKELKKKSKEGNSSAKTAPAVENKHEKKAELPPVEIQKQKKDTLQQTTGNREEKEYMEGDKRVTQITIIKNGTTHVYKKIVYVWGVFYMCDNKNITESSYIQDALK